MKLFKGLTIGILAAGLLIGECGCSSLNNTGKGALIGGGGGAALGAGLGAIIGGGKGAGIGSAIGAAVGAGAGALIGNKMDKQQKQLEQQLGDQAKVEQTTDQNGLQAIKVTFDGGILFGTNKYNLSPQAQSDLVRFAASLKDNPDTNVQIYGYTDNTGTFAVNEKLSNERAESVLSYQLRRVVHTNDGAGRSYGRLYRQQRYSCRTRTEPSCRNLHYRKQGNDSESRKRHAEVSF